MTAHDISLADAMIQRRSVRGFTDKPVPKEVLDAVFSLAQRSPSNCNIQPWKVWVASGAVRDALREGDPQEAARLLTRPFAIRGVVQHGDKRGREIGYPTANLPVEHYLRPRYGIYAVTGRILSTGQELKGAANIGVRPQFDPPKELLEPYFFDFSGDLYGQEIEVAFHHFLRGEAKFDSLDALVAQMEKDCDEARRLLG